MTDDWHTFVGTHCSKCGCHVEDVYDEPCLADTPLPSDPVLPSLMPLVWTILILGVLAFGAGMTFMFIPVEMLP